MRRAGSTRVRSTPVLLGLWVLGASCAPQQAPRTEPADRSESRTAPAEAELAAATVEVSELGDANVALAHALGDGVLAACVPPAPGAQAATERQRCADGLTALKAFRDAASDPVQWGAQAPGAGYELDASRTTQMNARVLRRMYLSTFAFGPGYRVEPTPAGVVLHVPSRFRQDLDAGDYPYPFWHSADKWRSYERTRELLFFIENGSLVAVLRSENQDPERPHVEHAWDGRWQWESARGHEPQNALYASLFSASNPVVPELEAAYRAFEKAQRPTACTSCHDPLNRAKVNRLELFSYPNQALSGRHDLVRELDANAMPPASSSTPAGIADPAQREELRRLAQRFAQLGDAALRFEGEHVPERP